ncbi:uncharacterized protein EI90DRAFT_3032237 [Cantharellus anzutake]|uniref:uncharacterized protein n=1 Tax=Cantharellus anzutake TaxID=1750568 RepID=UPI001907DCBE|nr:uncharacterized protein EI90DRAFT_3081906 [Cantharellus anzutake]XP_038922775.1 uncharacterized protein EI90DRAFT_3032237 [Cantharellus anzutake]KAF8319591.1 hypothetical protein EI90DRAFT_3081906 [Cantharellus anzutake]KAF8342136.1 hypothetical protein EI90DRAFT_3032237 [Cantharellus anzutake]
MASTLAQNVPRIPPSRMPTAIPTHIKDVGSSIGGKVRLVGTAYVYDVFTGLMLVGYESWSIWVDTSVCFDPSNTKSVPFLREYNSDVMLIGNIEEAYDSLPPPSLRDCRALRGFYSQLILRAIHIQGVHGLDIDCWNSSVAV